MNKEIKRSYRYPLHHVGVVVPNIEEAAKAYRFLWQPHDVTEVILDETQRVRVMFMGVGCGVSIELVEPCGVHSPVNKFSAKGGGLHHLCFEVDDIGTALRRYLSQGAIVVCEPVPATAFAGRKIAFLYTANHLLVELLQRSL